MIDDAAKTKEQLLEELHMLREQNAALEALERERKQFEDALRLSENRFRTLVEQAPFSIQILAPSGYTIKVNRAWEVLWGVKFEQIANYNMLEDQQLVEKGIMPYIKRGFSGEVVNIPAIQYNPDQTLPDKSLHKNPSRWVSAVLYPIKDDTDAISELVLIHEDITEQVLAETALRESEQRYRLLVELSPIPIAVHKAGTLVYINPAAVAMIGAAQSSDLIGHSVLGFVHPDYRAIVIARMQSTQELGLPVDRIEEKFIRVDGQSIDVEVVAIPIVYDGQQATQVVMRDITERKRAEQAQQFLAEATRLLSGSLDYETTLVNLARLVIPTLGDWCFVDVVDKDRVIHRVAVAAADPEKERVLHEVKRRYPPTWNSPQPAAQALRNESPVFIPTFAGGSLQATTRDAEHLRLLEKLNPGSALAIPLMARGQTIGVITFAYSESGRLYTTDDIALAQDLAQRAAIAVDNSRLYQESKDAVKARDEFLSVAAHELKTPITSMRGFAELNLRYMNKSGSFDAARVQHAFEVIQDQTHKLSRLIAQLLDVSRIEAGRMLLERQATNVTQLIQNVVARLQTNTDKHIITIQGELPVQLNVDPLRIEQVISNLIDNAIKYSPDGGKIEIQLSQHGIEAVQISVRDYGVGIPPERREHIFNRFYQAHPGSQLSGLGLGLYISHQIIELHEGTISAEFPDEGGTRFIIVLPTK